MQSHQQLLLFIKRSNSESKCVLGAFTFANNTKIKKIKKTVDFRYKGVVQLARFTT
jgi:hypothetical protein